MDVRVEGLGDISSELGPSPCTPRVAPAIRGALRWAALMAVGADPPGRFESFGAVLLRAAWKAVASTSVG